MYNITLICTTHKDIGNCNSEELYKIIYYHNPEIIFEELRPTIYDECYTFNSFGIPERTTLESKAITMYLQTHDLKHIAVVSTDEDENLDTKFNSMNAYQSWRNIISEIEFLERCHGFSFINSPECEQLFEDIKTLEKKVLESSGNESLSQIFLLADKGVNDYEDGIIKNIYQYSEANKYDTALMFIGAAHRKSIIQKIQEYDKASKLKLNWTLYNKV